MSKIKLLFFFTLCFNSIIFSAPQLLTPDNHLNLSTYNIGFLWQSSDNKKTKKEFIIEIAKNKEFNPLTYYKKTYKMEDEVFLMPGKYYWRIGERDKSLIEYSVVYDFTITNSIEGTIKDIKISEDEETNTLHIFFNPISNDNKIEYEVSLDNAFENIIYSCVINVDEETIVLRNGTYYLRTKLRNEKTGDIKFWNEPIWLILKSKTIYNKDESEIDRLNSIIQDNEKKFQRQKIELENRILKLTDDLNNAKANILKLQEINKSLEEELKTKNIEINKVLELSETLKKSEEELSAKSKEVLEKESELKAKEADFIEKEIEYRQDKNNLEQKIIKLLEEKNKIESEFKIVNQNLEINNKKIMDMDSLYKKNLLQKNDEIFQLSNELNNYKSKLDAKEKENLELSNKIVQLQNNLKQMENVISENDKLKNELKNADNIILQLNNDVSRLKSENAQKTDELKQLKNTENELQKNYDKIISENSKLKNELDTAKDRVKKLEKSNNELNSLLNDKEGEFKNAETNIKNLESKLNFLSDKLKNAEEELKQKETKIAELSNEIKSNEEKIFILENNLKSKNNEIEKLTNEANQSKNIIAQKENNVASLINDLKVAQENVALRDGKINILTNELKSVKEKTAIKYDELKSFEKEFNEAKEAQKQLVEENEQLKTQIENIRDELTALNNSNIKNETKIIELNNSVFEYKSKYEKTQARLDTMLRLEYEKLIESGKNDFLNQKFDKAKEKFEAAKILDNKNDVAMFNLAVLYYNQNRFEEALNEINAALSVNSSNIENKIFKIYILMKMNNISETKKFISGLSVEEKSNAKIEKIINSLEPAIKE